MMMPADNVGARVGSI